MRLNLGSGYNKEVGEITIDIDRNSKPMVVGDAHNLPFKDGVFDEVFACHVLEHLDDIVRVMNEIHRVMSKGASLVVVVPEYPHWSSVADPSHKRFFIPQTFEYFVKEGKLTGLNHVFQWKDLAKEIYTDPTTKIEFPSLIWRAEK